MKLTIKSKDNISYIKNHYILEKNKIKLKYFLHMMYSILKKIKIVNYKYIKKTNIQVKEKATFFIPYKISEQINKTLYDQYIFKLKKQNYNFTINIYSNTIINIKTYIKYIKTILLLFIHYKPITYIKYNTITIYLTDMEKQLNGIKITPYNVNSGYTYKNEIKICRKEEWFKVFIHECMHLFEFDFHDYSDFSILKQYIPIKSDFLLFELYSEFWARIMNIIIASMNDSFSIFKKQFYKYLKMEQLYSALSAKKILHFHNLDYEGILQKNNYEEETNVFCYYILTSLLLYFVEDTMYFFSIHNSNVFQFNKKHVEAFIEYIIKIHKKEEWIHYLNSLTYFQTPNINMSLYDYF